MTSFDFIHFWTVTCKVAGDLIQPLIEHRARVSLCRHPRRFGWLAQTKKNLQFIPLTSLSPWLTCLVVSLTEMLFFFSAGFTLQSALYQAELTTLDFVSMRGHTAVHTVNTQRRERKRGEKKNVLLQSAGSTSIHSFLCKQRTCERQQQRTNRLRK